MSVAGILSKLRLIKYPHHIYLVGGIVRDILLKRETNDIDLVGKNVQVLAKKLAKVSGGSYFVLDDENKIYRVVFNQSTFNDSSRQALAGRRLSTVFTVDFAELRGKNIEDDLALRDFTVDALAVRADNRWQVTGDRKSIIDSFGGQKDLKNKTIRMVNKNVFKDDPLRLLRAFRLAAELDFEIEKKTLTLIANQCRLIKKSAPERIREELLKIVSIPHSAASFQYLDDVGLLEILFPELKKQKITARNFYGKHGVWTHTLSGLSQLESILAQLKRYLPKHYLHLKKHLDEFVAGDISRSAILKLAFILHDFGKPATQTIEGERSRFFAHELAGAKIAGKTLTRLHFSNKEIHTVKNIILNHMRPGNLSSLDTITDKAIYRYFRDLREEGLDTLVLSLADAFTTADTVIARKKQHIYPVDAHRHLQKVRDIINRYYTRKKQIVPKNILNGHEIIKYFGLSEGPEIGQLIEALKEAQAQKLVGTKKQAYEYLTRILLRDRA